MAPDAAACDPSRHPAPAAASSSGAARGGDTIVALATAAGPAAVAVLRLSGHGVRVLGALLAPDRAPPPSHRLARRTLRDAAGAPLDDAMIVYMLAPRSYTGEDVLELHLHGGPATVAAVTARCRELGARPARPGEFTERAFVGGRMDLCQAEAVAQLIAAQGEAQRRCAVAQLSGGLSSSIGAIIDRLAGWAAPRRARLDFPDDVGDPVGHAAGSATHGVPPGRAQDAAGRLGEVDAPPANPASVASLAAAEAAVRGMLGQSRLEAVARPMKVVLCGPPNAGKSTLVNRWLHQERVLVDPEAGTTRDAVAVTVSRGASSFTVLDTAGIRDGSAASPLERRGMAMARRWAAAADLCLWLQPAAPAERTTPAAAADQEGAWPPADWPAKAVVVGTKSDLASDAGRSLQLAAAASRGLEHWGFVAAADAGSCEALAARAAAALATGRGGQGEASWAVNERHVAALETALDKLSFARDLAVRGDAEDVLTAAVEQAMSSLADILGRDVGRSLIDQVFANFCIGK